MTPTESVSFRRPRQSKISQPAQVSPERQQTTAVTNPHHRLARRARQTNGEGVQIDENFAATKDMQNIQIENQLEELQHPQTPKKRQSPRKNSQFKADQVDVSDFQSTYVQQIQTSNG